MSPVRPRDESGVEPAHYYRTDYDSKRRFIAYWHQIHEVISLQPSQTLEIGCGNKFLSSYLEDRGWRTVTFDIDSRLSPDCSGSVLSLPVATAACDVVCCFEVLEHLPFSLFAESLREIHRVSDNHAVISVPDVSRLFRIDLQIPGLARLKALGPLPRLKDPLHRFDGQHYWEIGKASYPLERVIGHIREAGFRVEKTYRVFEACEFRFFVLEKVSSPERN